MARSNKKPKNKNYYSIDDGIIWLLGTKYGVKKCEVENFRSNFRSKYNHNISGEKPDIIIPKLLSMLKNHNKFCIKKQVLTLSIAHNLRNYGGHNIKQQHILTKKYNQIIDQLLMSLFLCLKT
jgi:hypothetical protein